MTKTDLTGEVLSLLLLCGASVLYHVGIEHGSAKDPSLQEVLFIR